MCGFFVHALGAIWSPFHGTVKVGSGQRQFIYVRHTLDHLYLHGETLPTQALPQVMAPTFLQSPSQGQQIPFLILPLDAELSGIFWYNREQGMTAVRKYERSSKSSKKANILRKKCMDLQLSLFFQQLFKMLCHNDRKFGSLATPAGGGERDANLGFDFFFNSPCAFFSLEQK